jgi:hypothetical protein
MYHSDAILLLHGSCCSWYPLIDTDDRQCQWINSLSNMSNSHQFFFLPIPFNFLETNCVFWDGSSSEQERKFLAVISSMNFCDHSTLRRLQISHRFWGRRPIASPRQ